MHHAPLQECSSWTRAKYSVCFETTMWNRVGGAAGQCGSRVRLSFLPKQPPVLNVLVACCCLSSGKNGEALEMLSNVDNAAVWPRQICGHAKDEKLGSLQTRPPHQLVPTPELPAATAFCVHRSNALWSCKFCHDAMTAQYYIHMSPSYPRRSGKVGT